MRKRFTLRGWRPVITSFVVASVLALAFGPAPLPWESAHGSDRAVRCAGPGSCDR
ncbi:hypothetical protein ACGH2B_18235 [Streptomyces sp. BBFR2]|uniref:hypothetical protein n=1 Tax=Streptomyces sp. BBFR2 TaxID=3372854 RepID=UPI0037D9E358